MPPFQNARADLVVLRAGETAALVDRVGATLRSLTLDGVALVDGDTGSSYVSSGRGQVLAPWPNRLEDGVYAFAGRDGHVPLDEPSRHNAIHGLVRWLRWEVVEAGASSVRLSCPLAAQPAYPFSIRLEVSYRLTASGLEVAVEASSTMGEPAPFGIGFHPYLAAGVEPVDGAELFVAAGRRILSDGRGLPAGEEDVGGTSYDFRVARRIGDAVLDDCFTALVPAERDPASGMGLVAAVGAGGEAGRRVELWAEDCFGWLMCFTGDTIKDPGRRRRSVAVEPMTCPPNALRSGVGVITLGHEPWRGRFGLRAR